MTTDARTQHLIGLTEDEAVAAAKADGFVTRVTSRDGKSYIVTMDLRGDRYNLAINKGVVTSVNIG